MNYKRKIPHSYERNIVEIRNEYTEFLKNIITPLIYEGLKSVYNFAQKSHDELVAKSKNSSTKSPGILKIFQVGLKELPSLNSHQIDLETNRIKEHSMCSEWFDDLVKAVVKSNIILLTFTTSKNQSHVVEQKYHERIKTSDFIHKCYIESAKIIYNNPELFWHEFSLLEIQKNQRKIYEIIRIAISEAIRKMLPIKLVLTEFLQNDYIDEEEIKEDTQNYEYIKAMAKRDVGTGEDSYVNISLKDTQNSKEKEERKENFKIVTINNSHSDINNALENNNQNNDQNVNNMNQNINNNQNSNQNINNNQNMNGGNSDSERNSFEEITDSNMTDIDSVENKLFNIERGIREVNEDEFSKKENDEINVIRKKLSENPPSSRNMSNTNVKDYFADFTK